MPTAQEQFWQSAFGDEYVRRNGIANWRARVPFWRHVIDITKPRSILEAGCNAGLNLRAIRHVAPEVNLCGCDINQTALEAAADDGHVVAEASIFDLGNVWWEKFDLVFSAGVLIHVAPADIERAMRCIIAASKRYVLAVEYADTKETEVSYRGHADRLWRRPFGQMYQDLGMKLVAEGDAEGFDRCKFWIMERA
jgi:pseudaminic acid biosynthesis-associated methylase